MHNINLLQTASQIHIKKNVQEFSDDGIIKDNGQQLARFVKKVILICDGHSNKDKTISINISKIQNNLENISKEFTGLTCVKR